MFLGTISPEEMSGVYGISSQNYDRVNKTHASEIVRKWFKVSMYYSKICSTSTIKALGIGMHIKFAYMHCL